MCICIWLWPLVVCFYVRDWFSCLDVSCIVAFSSWENVHSFHFLLVCLFEVIMCPFFTQFDYNLTLKKKKKSMFSSWVFCGQEICSIWVFVCPSIIYTNSPPPALTVAYKVTPPAVCNNKIKKKKNVHLPSCLVREKACRKRKWEWVFH